MTRTGEDYEDRRLGVHLTGELTGNGPFLTRMSYLLVEESMMRDCLPGVVIDPFQDTLVQRMRTAILPRLDLARQGVFLSGSLTCT
jgi:hypothetical protein